MVELTHRPESERREVEERGREKEGEAKWVFVYIVMTLKLERKKEFILFD
jgi:hypothetical protein